MSFRKFPDTEYHCIDVKTFVLCRLNDDQTVDSMPHNKKALNGNPKICLTDGLCLYDGHAILVGCQPYAAHCESKWPVYATVVQVKRNGSG